MVFVGLLNNDNFSAHHFYVAVKLGSHMLFILILFYLVDFFKHIRKHAFTQTSKTPRTFSFYTSTGEVKPHVTLDGWARHSAPGLSLVNHKRNNFCMYSLDTICTEGYYFTQRAIGHIQFLTQPWWQLILGVVREIIIGI